MRRYWYLWLAAVVVVVIWLTADASIEHEWYARADAYIEREAIR